MYDSIFRSNSEEVDPRETEEDRKERLAREAASHNINRQKAWLTLIYMVAKGNILEFAQIYGLNAHLFLSFVSFEKNNKKIYEYVNRRGDYDPARTGKARR